jgi:CheY-like chemotaxis protein
MPPAFRSRTGPVSVNGTVPPARPKKILMVNPDLAVATVFQEKLEQEKFAVEVVGNPRLALRIVELDPVDLVVVDLCRSCFDAAQLVNAIRSQPGGKTLPVIVRLNPHFMARAQTAVDASAIRWAATSLCTPTRLLRIVSEALAPDSEEPDATPCEETEPEAHAANIFFACAPYTIARLWTCHRAFLASQEDAVRRAELFDMQRQAGILGSAAGLAGFREISELACALEAFLIQLHSDPAKITAPVMRMLAPAVDVLAFFIERAVPRPPIPDANFAVAISEQPGHPTGSRSDKAHVHAGRFRRRPCRSAEPGPLSPERRKRTYREIFAGTTLSLG